MHWSSSTYGEFVKEINRERRFTACITALSECPLMFVDLFPKWNPQTKCAQHYSEVKLVASLGDTMIADGRAKMIDNEVIAEAYLKNLSLNASNIKSQNTMTEYELHVIQSPRMDVQQQYREIVIHDIHSQSSAASYSTPVANVSTFDSNVSQRTFSESATSLSPPPVSRMLVDVGLKKTLDKSVTSDYGDCPFQPFPTGCSSPQSKCQFESGDIKDNALLSSTFNLVVNDEFDPIMDQEIHSHKSSANNSNANLSMIATSQQAPDQTRDVTTETVHSVTQSLNTEDKMSVEKSLNDSVSPTSNTGSSGRATKPLKFMNDESKCRKVNVPGNTFVGNVSGTIDMPSNETEVSEEEFNTWEWPFKPFVFTLPVDNWIPVSVSFIDSPHCFWVHLCNEEFVQLLDPLQKELDVYYNTVDVLALRKAANDHELKVYDLVCAKFSEDGSFYRAEVLAISYQEIEEGGRRNREDKAVNRSLRTIKRVQVFYVDYGNSEWVPHQVIFPLHPKFTTMPPQSLCCRLENISPMRQNDVRTGAEWSQSATHKFSDLTGVTTDNNKIVHGFVHGRENNTTVE